VREKRRRRRGGRRGEGGTYQHIDFTEGKDRSKRDRVKETRQPHVSDEVCHVPGHQEGYGSSFVGIDALL
jgi:hypothetical protein